MKKRFFAVLLALALCVALLPTAALADDETTATVDTEAALKGALSGTADIIQLTNDIQLTETITISRTVTFDLNGKKLSGANGSDATGDDMDGDNGGTAIIVNGGSLTVNGGTITGGNGGDGGSTGGRNGSGGTAIIVNSGSLTVNGGTITGGNGGGGGGGAAITVNGGSLTVNGGTITGGNGGSNDAFGGNGGSGGSGLLIESGIVTVGGSGAIKGGNGGPGSCGGDGGNGGNGLLIKGGTVTVGGSGAIKGGNGGSGSNSGNGGNGGNGLLIKSGNVTVGGSAAITGGNGGAAGGVYSNGGDGGKTISLSGTGSIGVSSEAALRAAVEAGASKIKLTSDITLTTTLEYKEKQITLDLNGHVINGKIRLVGQSSGTETALTLTDSAPTATHSTLPDGGVVNGQIVLTRDSGGKNVVLYANGGTVTGTVTPGGAAKIVCTSTTPTAFKGAVDGVTDNGSFITCAGTIYGGIFYNDVGKTYTEGFNTPYENEHIFGKTITFMNGDKRYAFEVVGSGKTSVAPIAPVSDAGDIFAGWYMDEDCTEGNKYEFSTSVTKNMTLYAKWMPKEYIVTYDPGSEADAGQAEQTDTKQYGTALTLKGETFTREGYKQSMWKTADGAEYALGASYTANAAVTLYPVWTPKTSEVTPAAAYYQVEHYLQKDNGDYELKETEMLCDLLDKNVTATPKEYDGYHYNAEKSTASGKIKMPEVVEGELDILTLKLYYDKDVSLLPILSMLPGAFENVAGLLDTTFVDVSRGAYYYNAVEWAANHGIAGGVDSRHFAPDESCTRAQAVTMMWRAAGCPDIWGENPFVDVDASDYYYEAVLWAVANGITSGTDEDHFSPDEPCTRGQIVTFLHRAARCYVAHDNFGFTDVKTSSYCEDAINWAVENAITNGTSEGTFSPDSVCTRGQIVTFLYRNR